MAKCRRHAEDVEEQIAMNPTRVIYEDAPDLIPVPDGMRHRRTEVIFWPLDEASDEPVRPGVRRRSPPSALAGKVQETGDVMSSISARDWGMDE